jgi:hypothetical protein
MGRKNKSDGATKKTAKPKRPRKAKEVEVIKMDDDENSQISIVVTMNDDDQIDRIEVPANESPTQEFELLEVDEGTTDGMSPPELEPFGSTEEDPELLITQEGSVLIAYKDQTIVEHICARCNKSFKSIKVGVCGQLSQYRSCIVLFSRV